MITQNGILPNSAMLWLVESSIVTVKYYISASNPSIDDLWYILQWYKNNFSAKIYRSVCIKMYILFAQEKFRSSITTCVKPVAKIVRKFRRL